MAKDSFFRDRSGYKRMGHLLSFLMVISSIVTIVFGMAVLVWEISHQLSSALGLSIIGIGFGEGVVGGGLEAWSDNGDTERERINPNSADKTENAEKDDFSS